MAMLASGLDRSRFEPGLLIFTAADKVHYPHALEKDIWFRALGLSGHSRVALPPKLVWGIQRAVRDFRPDIVHSSLNVANHFVRATAILFRWRVPVITSVRNDFRNGYRRSERLAERLLWRRSATITCNSERVMEQLVSDLGIPGGRVVCIPNGIDDRFFSAEEISLPDWWPGGNVALFVGRFSRQKNPVALIDAFGDALATADPGRWTLLLVGEGPLEAEMRGKIYQRGLDNRVLIRRPERNVRPLYRGASLLILPSLYEGTPNVCLEAASSGCPVAATRGAGVEALLSAGGGWQLETALSDMSRDLAAILGLSAREREAAGTYGRNHVRRAHTAAAMVSANEDLYDALAGAGRQRLPYGRTTTDE